MIGTDKDTLEKLFRAEFPGWNLRRQHAAEARRYYANETDSKQRSLRSASGELVENPLRQADNRLSHRWHGLLTDQKASYVATYPPLVDLGSDASNRRLSALLGDGWGRCFRHLVIHATNAGRAWVHIWEEKGRRRYALVEDEQLLPRYGDSLEKKLVGVLRQYQFVDEKGDRYTALECWDDTSCTAWRTKSIVVGDWEPYPCFSMANLDTGEKTSVHTYRHGMGRVPFIPFANNAVEKGDLRLMYKDLVDLYDRVVSGYANDIEDIQQVIFILDNYGGEDLKSFLENLRHYKTAKLDREDSTAPSSLTTLAVDIPVEARNSLLNILRRDILAFGQGVDPDPESLGNVSGVGIRHKYGLLELKAGALETEFRPAVAELVRLLLPELPVDSPIKQTWTRNLIQNDLEQAQVVGMLAGITSRRTLDENNPLVDDVSTEGERRAAEAHTEPL